MTKQIEDQLKANLPAQMVSADMDVFDIMEMMPAEQREALVEEMGDQLDEIPDSILDQAAVSYVRSAYENVGMDRIRCRRTISCQRAERWRLLHFSEWRQA